MASIHKVRHSATLYKIECVPMDVWMKRVMERFYPDGFPDFVLQYAGIAQQYIFHYIRNIENG